MRYGRLAMVLATVGMLAMASSAFALPVYDAGTQTLTYNAGDYDSVVDEQPVFLDTPPSVEHGNTLRAAFNALTPRVVAFNEATQQAGGPWVTKIVCNYAGGSVTFDRFHNTGGLGYGGWDIHGPQAFSAQPDTDSWDFAFNGGPGNHSEYTTWHWFGCDVSPSNPNEIVTGFALCVSGQASGLPTKWGDVRFHLTDGTTDTQTYASFGAGTSHQGICIAYVVPTPGVGITQVEIESMGAHQGGSVQYDGLDDLAFLVSELPPGIIPEPAGLGLVGLALLGLKKKRS